MVVYVVFAITPNPVEVGQSTYLFGNVNEDGVPQIDTNVEVFAAGEKIFDLWTDNNGDYVVELIPDDTWIGSTDVQVFVPLYAGYWSNIVALVVTGLQEFPCPYCGLIFYSQAELDAHILLMHPELPPPPINPLWVVGAAAVGLYLFGRWKGGKKGGG